jgi:DNA repair exonuclease SbcCD ATPase subunit
MTRWDTPVIRDRDDTGDAGAHSFGTRIGGAEPPGFAEAETVALEVSGVAETRPQDAVTIWPCANCGRPIPQHGRGARTVRYCQDNGGTCGEEAQRRRQQGLNAPGLTGQVAWAWAMVDRLEGMTERLAGSLASELGLAGLERHVAEARAESITQLAVAQEERDAARRQAETALRQAALDRSRAEAAERDAAAARAAMEEAVAERDAALRDSARTREASEQDGAARVAAEGERDRVLGREGELLEALEAARSELVELHSRVSESERVVDARRIESTAARRATEDLRSALHEAETKRGQAIADRDQIQARLQECEQHKWQLARAVEDLRAAIAGLTVERDAAREEADRARRRVDAYTQTTPRTGTRPPVEREPPTGLHPLNGMHLPPAG